MSSTFHLQSKIRKAGELKGEGNRFFKEGKHEKARTKYQQALQQLENTAFNEALEDECHKLSANLLFNVGTCYSHQKKWKDAEIFYNKALAIDPTYVKALYKRAMARYQLGEYDGSMTDIKAAHELDKVNEDIFSAYEKIRKKFNEDVRKKASKKEKSSYFCFYKEPSKKTQQKKSKVSGWWLLAMAPLAAAAIYQGVKFWKKP